MHLKQFFLGCLSHASYLIADEETKEAVVVDPQRDIDQYIAEAESHGFSIRHVLLTHFHADFLSGHLELRDKLGASIYLGAKAKADYPFVALKDGECIELGKVRLEVMETPGHTPEAVCVSVFDLQSDASSPHAVLTGDTLFVGDVGRPDLLASVGFTAQELAEMLYDSLHNKLMPLPDATLVYPAHGAGSMCGKNLGKETFSTIGQQRRFNYALQPMSKADFVKVVTEQQPEMPRYFAYNASLNKQIHGTLGEQMKNALTPLPLSEFLRLRDEGAQILDSRNPAEFCLSHLRGSINVGLGGTYATWAGTVLDPTIPILLVANPGREPEAIMRLGRIGFDNIAGYLDGGAEAFASNPNAVFSIPRITAPQLAEKLQQKEPPLVLDVRTVSEWNDKHIAGSLNVPLNQLQKRIAEVPTDREIVVHCLGGYRSTIAASILAEHGVTNMSDVTGGINGWIEAALPVVREAVKV